MISGSLLDRCIVHFDRALRTLAAPARSARPVPGGDLPEADLDEKTKKHTAALMRVNHVGEICAQALYQGQALTARTHQASEALCKAANEEVEHLAWTHQRVQEMGGRLSLLNPVWYAGALSIGVAAGLAGDRWSLGFLAETERQVEAHLAFHLEKIAPDDARTHSILSQMKVDEGAHADMAIALGAHALPSFVRVGMRLASRVMTSVAYRV